MFRVLTLHINLGFLRDQENDVSKSIYFMKLSQRGLCLKASGVMTSLRLNADFYVNASPSVIRSSTGS